MVVVAAMAIAIVDTGGHLIYFEKMQDTQTGSVEVAIEKARSAADAAKGDEASPFGPLVAEGAAYLQGHQAGDPYRGYRFRILTRQGPHAAGGAYNYVINGRMIAGFAMIAYPAGRGSIQSTAKTGTTC